MLTTISGTFVKIAFAHEAEIVLSRGLPQRPAARFNRRGQDALYLSPDATAANVAIGEYITPNDPPRVVIRFDVALCQLFDLRHPDAASVYDLASKPWRSALASSHEPPSWHAADRIRAAGHVGLIDPSRRRPGLWHVTFFKWNSAGGPRVTRIGQPEPIIVIPDLR